jgi:RNA polymerase sigma-70 factor (ECF subfamily)
MTSDIANHALAPDDDASLVVRIQSGERSAFELLMQRYNRRLYRLARATLRNDADANDALQNAYLLAYKSLHQFRGDASIATWLSRLVLNECMVRLRRHARREKVLPMSSPTAAIDEVPDSGTDAPDQKLARDQVRALLNRKLDELPRDFRQVFVLRSVEELSVEETAGILGIPEATIRTRHLRARSLLREALAREFDLVEQDIFEFGGTHCQRMVARVMARIDADPDP